MNPEALHSEPDVPPRGSAIPIWMQPTLLAAWPTQYVTHEALQYAMPVPEAWSQPPLEIVEPMTQTHVYRGLQPSEWLVVSFMPQATGGSDMRNWTDHIVSLIGFPVEQLLQAHEELPQLLAWDYTGPSAEGARIFDVDELHLYTGLAKWPDGLQGYMRIYQVLARKGDCAWKVSLLLTTACPPGTPQALVATNDHVRAGAVLGQLRFIGRD